MSTGLKSQAHRAIGASHLVDRRLRIIFVKKKYTYLIFVKQLKISYLEKNSGGRYKTNVLSYPVSEGVQHSIASNHPSPGADAA